MTNECDDMTVLLEKTIERTLDAWVREFESAAHRGARVQAWLFEGRQARRAAEQRLAQAGVRATFRSAYKPLLHYFLEEVSREDLVAATVRYPVHDKAAAKRFILEAYPLAGLLEGIALRFEPGSTDLHYQVELRYGDGRVEHASVYAPNRLAEDHAGIVNLSPTGWVKVTGHANGGDCDEQRATEHEQAFAAIVACVRDHPWGNAEPYFDRLEVHVELAGIEFALDYGDEVVSTYEALHEDVYFSLLEVFQRHSGRALGDRRLQPGQIIPDIHARADGPLRLRICTEPFEAFTEPAPAQDATPLSEVEAALPLDRIAYEMQSIGGKRFTATSRQGRTVLGTYVEGPGPAVVISGGQHANETSGPVGALRAAHALRERPHAHFALIGLENPDGYALHRRLCAVHPRHMHHAARYTALGDDLAYRQEEPLYERAGRDQARAISKAGLHISLHGYPAHEWTRPWSGYLPRGFELWTVPKGYFLVLRHHPGLRERAADMLDQMTARLARTLPDLVRFNARQVAMFQAHALERGFDILNGIPILLTEGHAESCPMVLISEYPDETVYGAAFRFAHEVQTETVLAAVDAYLLTSPNS
jgi:hypothetical protein